MSSSGFSSKLEDGAAWCSEHPVLCGSGAVVAVAAGYMAYRTLTARDLSRTKLEECYDYIIVGGGSSGCVLASRLSEDGTKTVLLLECGEEDKSTDIDIPAAAAKLQRCKFDWTLKTEKVEGTDQRIHNWPRGKVLGGCSSINYMLFVRGNRADYDEWASKHGCEGWSYDEVLPYFKKLEDYEGGANQYRGTGGPVPATVLKHPTKALQIFLDGAQEAGLEKNQDYNGEKQEGVAPFQMNVKDGLRYNTSRAYLKQVMGRKNLTVRTGTTVTRIIIKEGKAIGIAMKQSVGDEETIVACSLEVLLCCGAVHSPQILMLSGVGPKEELEKHKITQLVDLPGVGKNLLDHLVVFEIFSAKETIGYYPPRDENLYNLLQYLIKKDGPFVSCGCEGNIFYRTQPNLSYPDIQIHYAVATPDERIIANFGLHKKAELTEDTVSFGTTLLHPQSAGTITLKSSNPFDHPVIQPNYLKDESDMRTLMDGMKLCRKIAESPSMKKYLAGPVHDSIDSPWESDEYLKQYIRLNAVTLYHPVGTCKMGPEADNSSVVNHLLQVKGVKNLRVVDASVMPTLVSGNTNVPCIMIAERAAHIIQQSHQG